MEGNRREFLKKSALTGAVMWAAPVVTTLPKAGASGTTPSPCPCAGCRAEATGLRALGLTFGRAVDSNCECLPIANVQINSLVKASAQVACGKADNDACQASSFLAGLKLKVGETKALLGLLGTETYLEATVLSSCVDCGTGDALIADLKLKTYTVLLSGALQLKATVNLTVQTGCNKPVLGINLAGLSIISNKQFCMDGKLTVQALNVNILGLEVVVAESKAGNLGCACTPCATPRCTPRTVRLC